MSRQVVLGDNSAHSLGASADGHTPLVTYPPLMLSPAPSLVPPPARIGIAVSPSYVAQR
jgi:hypothetical protein